MDNFKENIQLKNRIDKDFTWKIPESHISQKSKNESPSKYSAASYNFCKSSIIIL